MLEWLTPIPQSFTGKRFYRYAIGGFFGRISVVKTMMLSSFHKHLPLNNVGLIKMCNAFEQLGIANLS
ncbi:MAG: hypothetical protein RMY16_17295 [Nostoc sp. DedQUE12b]|uniref:hypothetical protein n=1 Tax=Nostoc sp. DedQUE12b TaxID=3075398 RepID=UPI002AD34D26|nr:hypothetical protein [Nostoc sp. DedQUE12b]MDZ8087291.1 hypothetical protein [Nostoc sp. DedQUE12b]